MSKNRRYTHTASPTRGRQCQFCGAFRQDCTDTAPCCPCCTHTHRDRETA